MTVNAVQKNENKSHSASYIKSATIGGLGGYALKYILPVMPQEKEEHFDSFLTDLKKQVRESKLKAIDDIRNSPDKTLAADSFIRLVDKNELKASKIKELKGPLSFDVMDIVTQINDKGREVKACGKETFTALTKHVRSSSTFVTTGIGVAFVAAFVYNAFGKFSEK